MPRLKRNNDVRVKQLETTPLALLVRKRRVPSEEVVAINFVAHGVQKLR